LNFTTATATLIQGVIITPDTASLSASSVASTTITNIKITPAVAFATLELGFVEPILRHEIYLTTQVGSISFTGLTTTLTHQSLITPSDGTLSIQGNLPTTTKYIIPDTGSLTITGYAPSVPISSLSVPTGSISFTGETPSVIAGASAIITPDTGALEFESEYPYGFKGGSTLNFRGYKVSLDRTNIITPASATLTLTGSSPGVPEVVTPDTGSLALTGISATNDRAINGSAGSVSFASNAPGISYDTKITTVTGSISASGQVPITDRAIILSSGSSSLTGYAPTPDITFTTETIPVPSGSLQIEYPYQYPIERLYNTALFADHTALNEDIREWGLDVYPFVPSTLPSLVRGTVITPGTQAITYIGYAPDIDIIVGDKTRNIPTVVASLTGAAPSLLTNNIITPDTGTITASGNTPSITKGTIITPARREIRITPFPAGKEPILNLGITPSTTATELTGYVPTIIFPDTQITPGTGSVNVTGSGPTATTTVFNVWIDERDPVSDWVDEVPEYAVYGSGESGYAESGMSESGGAGHSSWADELEPVTVWADEN